MAMSYNFIKFIKFIIKQYIVCPNASNLFEIVYLFEF